MYPKITIAKYLRAHHVKNVYQDITLVRKENVNKLALYANRLIKIVAIVQLVTMVIKFPRVPASWQNQLTHTARNLTIKISVFLVIKVMLPFVENALTRIHCARVLILTLEDVLDVGQDTL